MSRLILPAHIEAEREKDLAFARRVYALRDLCYMSAALYILGHLIGVI